MKTYHNTFCSTFNTNFSRKHEINQALKSLEKYVKVFCLFVLFCFLFFCCFFFEVAHSTAILQISQVFFEEFVKVLRNFLHFIGDYQSKTPFKVKSFAGIYQTFIKQSNCIDLYAPVSRVPNNYLKQQFSVCHQITFHIINLSVSKCFHI